METNFGLRAAQALYAIAICFLVVSIISTAIALGRLIYTTWDYSMKYGLNNLITLESAWNETLQFKTSNSWKQISSNSNDSSAEITYDNGGSTISIELRNPTFLKTTISGRNQNAKCFQHVPTSTPKQRMLIKL